MRHRFDGGVEAYLDAIMLWNQGRYRGGRADNIGIIPASSPSNPFTQTVQVSFPVGGFNVDRKARFDSARYTAGLLAPLPLGWRATAEAAIGSAHYDYDQTNVEYAARVTPSRPAPNPFGNWTAFQAALAADRTTAVNTQTISNHFRDLSLRLAGPVFHTRAGASTLTLLAERRVEKVPAYVSLTVTDGVPSAATIAPRKSATTSVYAELRSRVFGEAAPAPALRNLEVQFAVRHDAETEDFSRNPRSTNIADRMRARFSGAVYTAGARSRRPPG